MKQSQVVSFGAALVIAAFISGCATITTSDSQPLAFSSTPQGTTVSINGVPRGATPTTIMVEKKSSAQMVTMTLEGNQAQQFKLVKHVASMTFGNIIFGGIIGAGVDIPTGKATKYQETVQVVLTPLRTPVQAPMTMAPVAMVPPPAPPPGAAVPPMGTMAPPPTVPTASPPIATPAAPAPAVPPAAGETNASKEAPAAPKTP